MGQKATDLMKNHKMAGLPKDEQCLLGKPAFFKAGFFIAHRLVMKNRRRKAL
jgi:hypothetical protein